jgi:hypothetical protein
MMKKFMFFALASAAMLASCSSDDAVAVDESNVAQTQDGPAAIQIGLGGAAFTRGTGTVGGIAGANEWAGQSFNLYMLKKDANGALTMNLASKNNTDAEATAIAGGDFTSAIYNNAVFNAPPSGDNGQAFANDGSVKYYPATGEYDFFAYRLDGAGTADPTMSATDITVPFTIDGSQDILVAKAIPTAAELTTLGTTPYYSARAARKSVQPQMTFKHLLSRLTFRVAPGNDGTASTTTFTVPVDPADPTGPTVTHDFAVHVTGIKVKSAVNGTLTVAATGDTDGDSQTITWGTADTDFDYVSVKERDPLLTVNDPLIALSDISLSGKWVAPSYAFDDASSVAVGEALLVAPQTTSYSMIVEGYQWVDLGGGNYEQRTFELPLDIKYLDTTDPANPVAKPFVAGTSYNVQIVVYGLQEIKVYVTLTPWENVTLDPIGQDE